MARKPRVANTTNSLIKFIITKFVKSDSINWPREYKICKQLVLLYPKVDFWQDLDLGFQLNSLAYFIKDGAGLLKNKDNIAKLDLSEKPKIKLGKENFLTETAVAVDKTAKTLKDFLK